MRADRGEDRVLRAVPWLACIAYFAIGMRYLYLAHPNEDAFILFKYVENTARGLGIVYYPGGPRTEGSTDFLWYALLTAMRFVGFDVAVAAAVLNAAGAWLAARLFCEAVRRSPVEGHARSAFALLALVVLFVPGTIAGYFGFSAMLYAALTTSLLCMCLWARASLPWIPLLALLVGLVRPDGLFLGAGFVVIGAWLAREAGLLRRYVVTALVAVVIGAAYFVWRRAYFGYDLPLPLYVKSYSSAGRPIADIVVAGLSSPIDWIDDDRFALAMSVALALLGLLALRAGRRPVLVFVTMLLPYVPYLMALAIANQIQNVAGRFQAPIHLAAYFTVFWLGLRAWSASRSLLARAALVLLLAVAMLPRLYDAYRQYRAYEGFHPYVDNFAPDFARILDPSRTVALTEAGRLSYWTEARVEDVIGLNTARNALAPPTNAYLHEIAPDVIMFHEGPMGLEFLLGGETRPVLPITTDDLVRSVQPHHHALLEHGLERYDANATPDEVAPILLTRFLCSGEPYDLYAVRYAGDYHHVYALRHELPEAPAILKALEDNAGGLVPYRPYAARVGFPFAFAIE